MRNSERDMLISALGAEISKLKNELDDIKKSCHMNRLGGYYIHPWWGEQRRVKTHRVSDVLEMVLNHLKLEIESFPSRVELVKRDKK